MRFYIFEKQIFFQLTKAISLITPNLLLLFYHYLSLNPLSYDSFDLYQHYYPIILIPKLKCNKK